MSGSHDDQIAATREEYNDARERLNQQTSEFSEFAKEGQRMIRITLIYAALLVNAINYSFSYGANSNVNSIPKFLFGLSGFCILGSLLYHTVGREVQGVNTIFEPDKDRSYDSDEMGAPSIYYEEKLDIYSKRIESNDDILRVFESNMGAAKAFLILSFGLTLLGFTVIFAPSAVVPTVIGFFILFYIYLYRLTKFPDQYYEREGHKNTGLLLKLKPYIQLTFLLPATGQDQRKRSPSGDNPNTKEDLEK